MDFAKNARVESYDDKIPFTAILGHLCGGREHQQIVLYREATLIAPSDSENERVSCCCQKTCWPKAKKRGASRDVHARYMYLYL